MKNRGNYKDLVVRQKSMQLVKDIYMLCSSFPKEEIYSLTSQIKRAALSIPANIAEGNTKSSNKHFRQFLETALGSTIEVLVFLEIAENVGYIEKGMNQNITDKTLEIQKMIGGLLSSLPD